MTRAAFRQADIERILRAAKATGSMVKIDIRTLECTIYPMPEDELRRADGFLPDGPENWDDHPRIPLRYGRENWDDLEPKPSKTRERKAKRPLVTAVEKVRSSEMSEADQIREELFIRSLKPKGRKPQE